MNKNQIILAATGGAIALVILASAYFAWDALSRKSEALAGDSEGLVVGLEEMAGRARSCLKKNPYPCAANIAVLEKNRRALEQWRLAARRLAAAGDWCEDESITPAQFKEKIIREARELMELPGTAENDRFMKPDFGFGPFQSYLGDVLPPRDQLARLQRQWYDITSLCSLLASNRVHQVLNIIVTDHHSESRKPAVVAKGKGKAKGRSGGAAPADPNDLPPSVVTYEISFQVEPADFTAIVRQLSARERFTVIDDFSFARVQDVMTERLGKSEKQENAAASSGRRGRRRAAAQEEAKADRRKKKGAPEQPQPEKKAVLVFDPAKEATLTAQLKVSVYDFRSLEKVAPDGEKVGKGASK